MMNLRAPTQFREAYRLHKNKVNLLENERHEVSVKQVRVDTVAKIVHKAR